MDEGQMTVVTVSRQLGSQGEEIATSVAEALSLRLIDAGSINRAAQKAGVPDIALAELENEGERGLADQVLKALRTMPSLRSASTFTTATAGERGTAHLEPPGLTIPFVGLFSPTVPPISASLESYVRMVGLVIRGLAREGNVLVVGRGGQVLLRKYPCALHVQIVAPMKDRINAVMTREGLQWRAAQSRVRASDRARFDYLRRYHDVNWLDPTLYHLVLNTGRVSVVTAVSLIVSAHQAIMRSADGAHVDG
jgi:cytidylate kinase